MSIFLKFLDNLVDHGLEYFRRYYSVYRGTCLDVEDPEEQGRILVRCPAVTRGNAHPAWAMPVMPWGGRDSGMFVVPDVGDPVYVMFENGDPRVPMYMGGYWPNVKGKGNYADGFDAYTDKKPTKRIFKTKAGHELSFEDDPENLSTKLVWHDPAEDKYSFIAFTSDGSLQMANHKGCFIELRTKDDEELILMMDKTGNMFVQDKDGTKIADPSGNFIELKDGALQLVAPGALVMNSPSINLKTGGVEIGDAATDDAVKGTAFMSWWKSTLLTWLNTHTHPTTSPGAPTGPPAVPSVAPVDSVVLSQKLKMQ